VLQRIATKAGEDGVVLVKFWLSISREEQISRFKSRAKNPLK